MLHRSSYCRLALGTSAVAAALCAAAPADTAAPRPNIIYILADDLGIGDVGAYGQQLVQTPNIDRLSQKGITFRNIYCPAPLCTPTRASQMTGLHNGHVYADRNGDGTGLDRPLRAQDITVAELLRSAGYSTGLVGKWGMGGGTGDLNPAVAASQVQTLPTNQGFQEVLAYLHQGRAHNYNVPSLWKNDPAAPNGVSLEPTNGVYTHDLFSQRAGQFIGDHADDDSPFYLQVNFTPPHFDLDAVPQQWRAPYEGLGWTDKKVKSAAMIAHLDARVGDVVARVEDPNGDGDTSDSIAANTLIIFASDNGPAKEDGSDPAFLDSNGIYRGYKRDLYEGGIRAPFIARWDGVIAPGATNTSYVGALEDFLPTAAELAGVEAPLGLDGVSIAPILTGQGTQRGREALVWEFHESSAGAAKPARWAVRHGDWKLIRFADNTYELYNLAADPAETTNLVAANPQLKQELEAIAIAEHVTRSDSYTVQYANWAGGSGAWSESARWDTGGVPQDNWIASLDNASGAAIKTRVSGHRSVLAFEVRGQNGATRVDVDYGQSLAARNGVRIHAGGEVNLIAAELDTARLIEIRPGGLMCGSGIARGVVVNQGRIAVGQPERYVPPPPVNTGVVRALTFDFTGVQDDAPLTATSTLHESLTISAGLNWGPGLGPRHPSGGSTDKGDEFNISGFEGSSLAAAITNNDYLTYTVSPVAGVTMKLNSVSFTLWRNGVNAPQNYAILTSLDGFAAGKQLGTVNVPTFGDITKQTVFTATYGGAEVASGPLEVRLYGWTATVTGNTHFTAASLDASFQSLPGEELGPNGILTLDGDLEHLDGAVLAMELFGHDGAPGVDFDKLIVRGSMLSSGALEVRLGDGFEPRLGDRFDVLDFDVFSGGFALDLPKLPGGLRWDASELGTTGMLAVVPEPGAMLALPLAVLLLSRRRSS